VKDRIPEPTAIVVGVIGMLCLVTGAGKLWHSWASCEWPTTDGSVLESRLVVESDAETTITDAFFWYEYRVDGTTYTNARISFSERAFNESKWAREFVAEHPVRSTIQVHYDPDFPPNAAIIVGLTPASFAQAVLGLVLLAIAAGYHLLSDRRLRT
jgi:hypothetical protein